MARGSRASKGRGPTRRERRDSAASDREKQRQSSDQPSSSRLSKRKQRAAANLARQAERREPSGAVWKQRLRSVAQRRVFYGAVIALAALLTLAMGVGWWLAERPPEWWVETDAGSPQVEATSRAVENWAVSTMTKAHPDGERWAVTITEEDANSWLAVRLPRWVESERGEWPEGIRSVRVRFYGGRIILGADIREAGDDEPRVVAAAFRLQVREAEGASLSIDWTQVNRLKLPGSVGVNRLSGWLDSAGEDQIADQLASLIRGELQAESLGWKLEDGRRITVHRVDIEAGKVHLTCSTASASASR